MIKKLNIYLLVALQVLCIYGFSQDGKYTGNGETIKGEIFGHLTDSISGYPMEFAAVSLISMDDDKIITGGISNHAGKFNLVDIPKGTYKIQISFVGYEQKERRNIEVSEKNRIVNLGEILLTTDNTLEEIVLDGSRPILNYEIDKKVVDVSRLQVDMGQTAVEILENIPSITVSVDGTVSLRGSSSFTLFIDGRPTALDANEALSIIPASTIKEIEIITNPSAKYESEGVSGIMNIITKSNKLEGLSMLLNASAGNYENYSSDVSVNMREEKYEINLGFNYRNRTRPSTLTSERISRYDSLTSIIKSEGESDWVMGGYGVNADFTFTPNSAHMITLGGRYNVRLMNGFNQLYFSEYNNDVNVLNYFNDQFSDREFNATSAFMTYQFNVKRDKDHYLRVRATYNDRTGDEIVQADYLDGNGVKQGGTRNTERGPSNKFRVNVDYSNLLNNGMTVEAGTQIQLGHSMDEGRNYDFNASTGEYELQPLFSSDAIYDRNIYGVYGLFKGASGALGYQFGIRGEYTDRRIEAVSFDQVADVNRMDWFPTVHFSYDLTDNQQLLLNYTRRIQRPRGYYLEPFITWRNAYSVYSGNPDLLPEYIDAVEMNWVNSFKNRKGFVSVETYVRHVNNFISRVQVPYDTNLLLTTPVNVGKTISVGVEPSLSYDMFKWWKVDLAFNVFSYTIQSSQDQLNSSQNVNWNSRLTNTFPLENNWNIQVSTRYISPTNTVQGNSVGYFTANGSVRKSFSKNKYALVFQVRDIFNSIRRESFSIAGNVESYDLSIPKTPRFVLTFSLRLNNYNKRQRSVEDGDEF